MTEDLLLPEDSMLLDQLVDGELNDDERRALLLRLERTPDGWRRCAMAFLEGQAWRSEAKSYASGTPEVAVRSIPAQAIPRSWKGGMPWSTFALAACVMVSLGVWMIVRDKDGNEFAKIAVPNGGGVVMQPQIVQSPSQSFPSNSPNMRLVVDGGPNQADEVVEVPLVEADQLDKALFGPWSQSVPPEVLQMLERSGHQVVRERQLMPVELRDGRRVVVPMDQVEIRPVGVRGYQ